MKKYKYSFGYPDVRILHPEATVVRTAYMPPPGAGQPQGDGTLSLSAALQLQPHEDEAVSRELHSRLDNGELFVGTAYDGTTDEKVLRTLYGRREALPHCRTFYSQRMCTIPLTVSRLLANPYQMVLVELFIEIVDAIASAYSVEAAHRAVENDNAFSLPRMVDYLSRVDYYSETGNRNATDLVVSILLCKLNQIGYPIGRARRVIYTLCDRGMHVALLELYDRGVITQRIVSEFSDAEKRDLIHVLARDTNQVFLQTKHMWPVEIVQHVHQIKQNSPVPIGRVTPPEAHVVRPRPRRY